MNVAAGGALHMDLTETFGEAQYPTHWLEQAWFHKCARIEPGSCLAAIVGEAGLWVNSVHRQAIERLGAGLTISAPETNGAVGREQARPLISDVRRRLKALTPDQ